MKKTKNILYAFFFFFGFVGYTKPVYIHSYHKTIDGWMVCNYTAFSTVLKSDSDNKRLIMKVLYKKNAAMDWKDFCIERVSNPEPLD